MTPNNLSTLSQNELAVRVMNLSTPPPTIRVRVFDEYAYASERLALFQGLADLRLKDQFITALHKAIGDENISTQVDTYWVCLTATGEELAQAFELIRNDVERALIERGKAQC